MQRIFFRDDFACLHRMFCNASDHPIELDDRRWPTVEHYFQAQKFLEFDLQEIIRRAPTARRAVELGRNPCLPLRAGWHDARESVMYRALRAKFTQYPHLAERLILTGDAQLINDSPDDTQWGAGPDRCGRNRLGILLMRLRAELAASRKTALRAAA
ncbi:MAG: NADAR family protein [Verrucomicrobia bacterium]|nr:NADAR family protein [Verrucomicrobiota bacterium]